MTCTHCGEKNSERARFCQSCGNELERGHAARKTVTLLFADLTGSTSLAERMDPERYGTIVGEFFAAMNEVVTRYDGVVSRYVGDELVGVFGMPQMREDDALRAVAAAHAMHARLAELNPGLEATWGESLAMRVAINTGEVAIGHDPAHGLQGDTANVAARLEKVASPGETVIGERTYRLVAHAVQAEALGPLDLKGKAVATAAYRILGVSDHAPIRAAAERARFTGRGHEMSLLRQSFDRAVRERRCHLFTLFGPPGIGKSRLAREFIQSLQGATAATGRCLSYGDGLTYWPVLEAIRSLATVAPEDGPSDTISKLTALVGDDAEATRIATIAAEGTGLVEGSASLEETFWSLRRLIEGAAQDRPHVLVFDDIHWGEPNFLALIEHLADRVRSAPVLILCLAREDLLEVRPTWGGGKLNATSLLVAPLERLEAVDLLGELLPGGTVGEELSETLLEAAEGNPLFLEELVAMLLEEGTLRLAEGRWERTPGAEEMPLPPSLHNVLAARLERLEPSERGALERAAVVGKEFRIAALPLPDDHTLQGLAGLARKDLIAPEPTGAPDQSLRFRHILIRDTAYASLALERRAELHVDVGDRLTAMGESRSRSDLVGYHLEQAHRYLSELGRRGPEVEDLAARASEQLADAGRRAAARGDEHAAVTLLGRAAALVPRDDEKRPQLALDLATSLVGLGDFSEGEDVLKETIALARELGDELAATHARLMLLDLQLFTDPEGKAEALLAEIERTIPVLEAAGDDLGLARAWRMRASAQSMWAVWSPMEEFLARAIEHARRAGHRREETESIKWLALALFWGPTPATQGIAQLDELLTRVDDLKTRAVILQERGGFLAMRGRFEDARVDVEQAQDINRDLGLDPTLTALEGAQIEMMSADPEAAARILSAACDYAERTGELSTLSTMAAMLAGAWAAAGRPDEGRKAAELSERTSATDDRASQAMLGVSLTKIALLEGDLPAAERSARDAVALARTTDMINLLGDALTMLGEVQTRRGTDATEAYDAALDSYQRKENLVGVEFLQNRLGASAALEH